MKSAQVRAAEDWIRELSAQGFSEREIARQGSTSTVPLSRATVWNVLNPQAGRGGKRPGVGRGGIKESEAWRIVGRFKKDQRMLLPQEGGSPLVMPFNNRERLKLQRYWDAVDLARKEGDWKSLERFRGKTVTVLEQGQRKTIKLLDDRDRATFKTLGDKHQLAETKEERTRYEKKRRRSKREGRS